MPKIFLLIILFFCFSEVWSENYQRKLTWNENSKDSSLTKGQTETFDGAVVLDKTGLPYWFESFELSSSNAKVLVLNATYEPVINPSILLKEHTGPDLKYSGETGVSAGRTFLRVTIFPFIQKNNQIERLTGFTLSIKENFVSVKSATAAYPWKSSSVLGSGAWIKIKANNRGIYKISTDQLKQWGFSNPDQVALYGAGGYMLPVLNKNTKFDDLPAYPFWKGKDNAGKDCIFFFSTGNISFTQDASTGDFTHQQNTYSTETYFYLTDSGTPKTIVKIPEVAGNAGRQVLSYPNYALYEKESVNLIKSGSQWFGEHFIAGSSQTVSLVLDNPDQTKPAGVVVSAAGKSSSATGMGVTLNGQSIGTIKFQSVDVSDPTSYFADGETGKFSASVSAKNADVKLTYNSSNNSSEAWLDYVVINYTSLLNMSSDVFFV